MSYQPPGSGLGGAHERKVALSLEKKKPLTGSSDRRSPEVKAALARQAEQELIHAEHLANQARLKEAWEASRPKPGPLAIRRRDQSAGEYYHELEQDGAFDA